MSFLPIVDRELRAASRRPSTYWTRTVLGLVACVLWLLLVATGGRHMQPSEMGKILFIMVSILALGFGIFAGVFLTADCLSEEKREGTLGLLFLTELRGYDVVLGKLMATSLPAFYAIMTILPILALPLLMGGVSFGEFLRVCLALVTTLAQSLCLGLGVSAFSRDARQAMSTTLLLVVAFSGIMPLLAWVIEVRTGLTDWRLLCLPSPGYLLNRAFDTNYRWGNAADFWKAFVTISALGLAGLLAAHLRLPRAWQEGGEGRVHRRVGDWMRRWRFGGASFRSSRRALLEVNPFHWLATRDRMPRWVALIGTAALLLFWLGLLAGCFSGASSTRDSCFAIAMAVALALHLVLKWAITAESARRFSEDRRSGALELLLVTPLPVSKIIAAQRRALLQAYALPLALALLTNLGLIWMMLGPNPLGMRNWDRPIFCELYAGGIVLLLADFLALTNLGMRLGLRARSHQRAILAVLARVLFPPWLGAILVWFIGVSGGFNGGPESVFGVFLLWQIFCLVLDLALTAVASESLAHELRHSGAGAPPRADASSSS